MEPFIPASIYNFNYYTRDKSEAIFAQGTYDLSSFARGMSFTTGFRYTWEQAYLNPYPESLYANAAPESTSFSDPSWEVGLQYQATSDLLLYVKNRGSWRAGGFNGTAPPTPVPGSQGGNEYLPETTYDVELGAKFQGEILGFSTRTNIAVYNQWIHDIQRVLYATFPDGTAGGVTTNVPAGEVTGVELDNETKFSRYFSIGGQFAWTEARYTEASSKLFNTTLTYGPWADTPKWAGSVFMKVTLPTPDNLGPMSLYGTVYGQTQTYYSNLGGTISPGVLLPGYGLLDIRFDWSHVFNSGLSVAGYARNLTNKAYYAGGVGQGSNFGVNSTSPGTPRMWGFELTYKF